MSSTPPVPGRRQAWTTLPLDEVIPPRAVLTELARGFLMVHEVDRESALRFAQTFLKERAGAPPTPSKVVPAERLASVRRGVASALRDSGPPPFEP
ncbi:MAG: hypothetical protein L3K00_02570 [Thermoplasmata archaeon]|nr:hypothetical protein [Thermoplasmata archaeon]